MAWFKTGFKKAQDILAFRSAHIQVNEHSVVPRNHIYHFSKSLRLVEYIDGTSDTVDDEFVAGIEREINRQKQVQKERVAYGNKRKKQG